MGRRRDGRGKHRLYKGVSMMAEDRAAAEAEVVMEAVKQFDSFHPAALRSLSEHMIKALDAHRQQSAPTVPTHEQIAQALAYRHYGPDARGIEWVWNEIVSLDEDERDEYLAQADAVLALFHDRARGEVVDHE